MFPRSPGFILRVLVKKLWTNIINDLLFGVLPTDINITTQFSGREYHVARNKGNGYIALNYNNIM